MHTFFPLRFWRWAALLVLAINVFFDQLLTVLAPSLPSIAAVSAAHPSLLTPAHYAFAIWGLIYAALLGYGIFQILPVQRDVAVHDRLSRPLLAYGLLGMGWLVAYRTSHVGLACLLIWAMFFAGALLFKRVQVARWTGAAPRYQATPFSLYFGWITAAALANTASWWQSRGGASTGWALAMVIAAGLAGLAIGGKWREWIYPLTLAWALVAIFVAQREVSFSVAIMALVVGLGMVGWAGFVALRLRRVRFVPRAPRKGARAFFKRTREARA